MVPFQENVHFVGRNLELNRLRSELGRTEPNRFNHRVAVHGLGGVGKKQLLLAYAMKYRSAYDGIYWINAADQTSLLSGFRDIVIETDCIQKIAKLEPKQIAISVLKWLIEQERCLLIIDNLDEISIIQEYLKCLSTSSSRQWHRVQGYFRHTIPAV
jgi:hypothetical protein